MNTLLNIIEKKNITDLSIKKEKKIDKLFKIINKDDNKKLIDKLINLLKNSLFKKDDKHFIIKYKNLLNNLGLYTNIYNLNNSNYDIKTENKLLSTKIELLKLYINDYFRKIYQLFQIILREKI